MNLVLLQKHLILLAQVQRLLEEIGKEQKQDNLVKRVLCTSSTTEAFQQMETGPGLLITGYYMLTARDVCESVHKLKQKNSEVVVLLHTSLHLEDIRPLPSDFDGKIPKDGPEDVKIMVRYLARVARGKDPRSLQDEFPTIKFFHK